MSLLKKKFISSRFTFEVMCPEMAVLLCLLKDYDNAGANDVLGEVPILCTSNVRNEVRPECPDHCFVMHLGYFALPLASLRPGQYQLQMYEPGTGKEKPLRKAWIKVCLTDQFWYQSLISAVRSKNDAI